MELFSEGPSHWVVPAGVKVLQGSALVAKTGLLMLKLVITTNGRSTNGTEVCV